MRWDVGCGWEFESSPLDVPFDAPFTGPSVKPSSDPVDELPALPLRLWPFTGNVAEPLIALGLRKASSTVAEGMALIGQNLNRYIVLGYSRSDPLGYCMAQSYRGQQRSSVTEYETRL